MPLTATAKVQNLQPYSEQLDQSAVGWTPSGTTITPNTAVFPVDGLTVMDTVTAVAGGTYHYVGTKSPNLVSAGKTSTISFFVKRNNNDWIYIALNNQSVSSFAFFNTATGLFGTVGALCAFVDVEDWGGGVYRISATYFNLVIGGATIGGLVGIASADNTPSFSAAGTEAVYACGGQVVPVNYAGPYTKTEATPVNTGNINNIVPTRQNLATYSDDLTNAAVTKVAMTAPTATTALESAGASQHYLSRTHAGLKIGKTYTITMIVTPNLGRTVGYFQLVDAANTYTPIDFATGALGTKVGTGAYVLSTEMLSGSRVKIICTFPCTAASTANYLGVATGTVGSVTYTYAGDITKGLTVENYQLVGGSRLSPHLRTTSIPLSIGDLPPVASALSPLGIGDAAYRALIAADGALYHWPMDEASGNFAALIGAIALNATSVGYRTAGKTDVPAAIFDGVASICASASTIDLRAYNRIVVEWLEYIPAFTTTGRLLLEMSSAFYSFDGGFVYSQDGGNSGVAAKSYLGLQGNVGVNYSEYARAAAGVWRHAALELDFSQAAATDELKLYWEGVVQTKSGVASLVANNTGNFNNRTLYVGARSGVVAPAQASIQHLAIYGGSGMTAAKILKHAQAAGRMRTLVT
jgi:hypothetical protein